MVTQRYFLFFIFYCQLYLGKHFYFNLQEVNHISSHNHPQILWWLLSGVFMQGFSLSTDCKGVTTIQEAVTAIYK